MPLATPGQVVLLAALTFALVWYFTGGFSY